MQTDGKLADARIALGSVAPTPLRAYEAEACLQDADPTEACFEQAAALAVQACSPISDVRASAEYRRQMVQVLVKRLLRETVKQIAAM